MVFGAHFLEIVRLHLEEEVIRENGITVLENGRNLRTRLVGEIKFLGLDHRTRHLRDVVVQGRDAEAVGDGLDGESRAVLLALQGITSDVRGGDIHHLHQFQVDVRLVVPGVDGYGTEPRDGPFEGGFVHQLSAGRVDEDGVVLHLGEETLVHHIAGALVERGVQGDDVRLLEQLVEGTEFAVLVALGRFARRVAKQYLEAQVTGQALHLLPHIADPDDAEAFAFDFDGFAGGHSVKGGEYILHHAAGVAAGSAVYLDAVRGAPVQVDVVGADGRRGDDLDRRSGEHRFVATGAGADDEGVRIQDILVGDELAVDVFHLGIGLEDSFEEGNILICYNPYHFNTI